MHSTFVSELISFGLTIVATIVLVVLAWNLWLTYIQIVFLRSIKWVVLEIKPPKEVFKSPLAMELVLNALYQTGGVGTWYDRYWKGQLRNWFSLEIVSFEGSIHFYLRTSDKFRKLIESQIYAQYPQAEVFEVEDYAAKFPDFKKGGPIGMWGCEFKLNKDDPYPIKTYVDYGLDRAVGSLDEEQRIDPITPTLEYMGSMGLGENILLQILVRADSKRFTVKGVPGKSWQDKAKELADDLRAKLKPAPVPGETVITPVNTKGQKDIIEAIERSIMKLGFDCGIRAIYLTDKDHFDANRIAALTGMLRQYNNGELNSFGIQHKTAFDLPWEDPLKTRADKLRTYMLSDYKHRSYFYGGFRFDKPFKYFTHPNASGEKPFILNTEELATLFHLPGRVAETPSFARIEATKAEPPANLPI